jgi:hypothetical protein
MMHSWTEHFNQLKKSEKKSELWRYTPLNSFIDFGETKDRNSLNESEIILPQLPDHISGEVLFYNGKTWMTHSKKIQINHDFNKNDQSLFEMPLQQKQLLDQDVCYAWYKTKIHEQMLQISGNNNLILYVPHSKEEMILPELNIILTNNTAPIKIYEIHYGVNQHDFFNTTLLSVKIFNQSDLTYHRFTLQEKLKSIHWLQVINQKQFKTYLWKHKEQFHKEYVSVDNKTSEAFSDIKYLANVCGKSALDLTTQMNHLSPETKSLQKFKCLLDDSSKAALTGKITIEKNCPQSSAHFRSKHTLLSDKAHVYSQPQLEIHTDDVECAHGSSTGALQEEELFYLISRGINPHAAKKLLLSAFLTDEILTLDSKEEQKFFKELIL